MQTIARIIVSIVVAIGSAGVDGSQPAGDGLATLRAACEAAIAEPPDLERLAELAERLRRFVDQTQDLNDQLSALKLAARLCFYSPMPLSGSLREYTLRKLADCATRSARARAMLTTQMLPPLHRVTAAERPGMLEQFDRQIDRLLAVTPDRATKADLEYLRCAARIEAHRAWPNTWMDAAALARLDGWLEALERAPAHPDAIPDDTYHTIVPPLRRELRDAAFGRVIADFAATDLNGNRVRLAEYGGQVTVLSFWSSWCLPCLKLIPQEVELHNRLKERGVTLVGVNSDPTTAQARETAKVNAITWPQLWSPPDDPNGLAAHLHIREWPSFVILGTDGAIRGKFVGSTYQHGWTMADVEREIVSILDSK